MLNAATIAAIVAAVWAHPQALDYLDKIEQLRVCAEAKGNPCCRSRYDGAKLREVTNKARKRLLLDDNELLEIIEMYMTMER